METNKDKKIYAYFSSKLYQRSEQNCKYDGVSVQLRIKNASCKDQKNAFDITKPIYNL